MLDPNLLPTLCPFPSGQGSNFKAFFEANTGPTWEVAITNAGGCPGEALAWQHPGGADMPSNQPCTALHNPSPGTWCRGTNAAAHGTFIPGGAIVAALAR